MDLYTLIRYIALFNFDIWFGPSYFYFPYSVLSFLYLCLVCLLCSCKSKCPPWGYIQCYLILLQLFLSKEVTQVREKKRAHTYHGESH